MTYKTNEEILKEFDNQKFSQYHTDDNSIRKLDDEDKIKSFLLQTRLQDKEAIMEMIENFGYVVLGKNSTCSKCGKQKCWCDIKREMVKCLPDEINRTDLLNKIKELK